MFDANLLFKNAATLTTTGTAALAIAKTPASGVDVEVAITTVAGSTTGRTIDFVIQESAGGTTASGTLATFTQMTTTGRQTRRVQSKQPYLILAYTMGTGTGLSVVVSAGIVAGPVNDQVV